MERIRTSVNVRGLGVGVLLAAGFMMPAANSEAVQPMQKTRQSAQASSDWELQWKETFDGNTLDERWEAVDNTSYKWDRFSQYRKIGQRVANGNLEIIIRGHCVAPGEDMTLANVQVEPCDANEVRSYSAGRVEQVIPDITGDYRIDMTIKLPTDPDGDPQEGIRFAGWRNNIDKEDPDSLNVGYCDEYSTTATAEGDLIEYYPEEDVDTVRASHHKWCEGGDMTEVPRTKRFRDGWLSKFHVYTEERIGNRVTYMIDGEKLRLRGIKGKTRYADKPSDFKGVSPKEQRMTDEYANSVIFDGRVFTNPDAPSAAFRAPDPTQPFYTQRMKVAEISVSVPSHQR